MINCETKFLTCDEKVTIKNVDLKVSKYESKKKTEETVYDSAKRSYIERRGGCSRVPRGRLLRELESKLRDCSLVLCEWLTDTLVAIVLSSGLIVYLTIKCSTLDVTNIVFDRYCVGKLAAQSVTGALISSTHLLFTHADSSATLVSLTPANHSSGAPTCIADRNPHIQIVELADGARRAERRITWSECSTPAWGACGAGAGARGAGAGARGAGAGACGAGAGDTRALVWTACGAEPAPWSPAPQVRANLHLYLLSGSEMCVVAYHQLESDTVLAEVERQDHATVHIIHQVNSHKSGVTIEWSRYSVPPRPEGVSRLAALRRGASGGAAAAAARGAAVRGTRAVVACIDGSLHVMHCDAGITHSIRAGFIAVRIEVTASCVICSEECGRVHCLDRALQLLHHSAKCLHLHSARESGSMRVVASRGARGSRGGAGGEPVLLLVSFSGGPLALVRLTHPSLPMGWARAGQPARALAALLAMDWDAAPRACRRHLHAIVAWCWSLRAEAARGAAAGALRQLAARRPPAPGVRALGLRLYLLMLRSNRVELAARFLPALSSWPHALDLRWAAEAAAAAGGAGAAGGRGAALAAAALRHAQDVRRAQAEASSSCSSSCSCSSCSRSPSPRAAPPRAAPPLPAATVPSDGLSASNRNTTSYQPLYKTELLEDPVYEGRVGLPDPGFPGPQGSGATGPGAAGPGAAGRGRGGEKNVKFSDTVTVAVVAASNTGTAGPLGVSVPCPWRELADSLPLCPPHDYLSAFDPAPPRAAPPPAPPRSHAGAQAHGDYVEL